MDNSRSKSKETENVDCSKENIGSGGICSPYPDNSPDDSEYRSESGNRSEGKGKETAIPTTAEEEDLLTGENPESVDVCMIFRTSGGETTDRQPLSVVASYREAEAYCSRYNFLLNRPAFRAWCRAGGKEEEDEGVYAEFTERVDPSVFRSQDFSIVKSSLDIRTFLSMARVDLGCLPLGMDWEDPEELKVYRDSVKEEDREEVSKEL